MGTGRISSQNILRTSEWYITLKLERLMEKYVLLAGIQLLGRGLAVFLD
jgi:hypothetical protein